VLSEQVIVQTALRLVGQHGADALTVRRLGAELGAAPACWSKGALLTALL
jgi:hypothetical protein